MSDTNKNVRCWPTYREGILCKFHNFMKISGKHFHVFCFNQTQGLALSKTCWKCTHSTTWRSDALTGTFIAIGLRLFFSTGITYELKTLFTFDLVLLHTFRLKGSPLKDLRSVTLNQLDWLIPQGHEFKMILKEHRKRNTMGQFVSHVHN